MENLNRVAISDAINSIEGINNQLQQSDARLSKLQESLKQASEVSFAYLKDTARVLLLAESDLRATLQKGIKAQIEEEQNKNTELLNRILSYLKVPNNG